MTPDQAHGLVNIATVDKADRRNGGRLSLAGSSHPAPSEPSTRPSPPFEVLIFVHLYKTGGTTLNRIIEWEYNLPRIASVEPTWWQWSYQRIMRWSPARLGRMDVFKGHMPFGLHRLLARPANYITFLREPIERAISDYYFARRFKPHQNHRASLELTLEEYFLQKHEHNMQSRILAGPNATELFPSVCDAATLAAAKENLARHFVVVGLTERFDETLALLKVVLGWRIKHYRAFRVSHNRIPQQSVAPKTLELIREWEKYDLDLYDYASSLFEEALASHSEAIEQALLTIREAKDMTPLKFRFYSVCSVARMVFCRAHSLL